jgi:hypothetical protein
MKPIFFVILSALLIFAPVPNHGCAVAPLIGVGANLLGKVLVIKLLKFCSMSLVRIVQRQLYVDLVLNYNFQQKGRADENVDFADLPDVLKQCVFRRAATDTTILSKVNKCSLNKGGANCVRNIAGLKSCFE